MTDHTLSIRPYRAETDLEPLSAIWFAASMKAHGFIGEERLRAQRGRIERDYLPAAKTTVACAGMEPVGFIALLGQFVGGLFVRPDMQGRGIGRILVEYALRQTGALELEVYTANVQALGFYRSLGFVELSRRAVDDDGLPFESLRMRREP